MTRRQEKYEATLRGEHSTHFKMRHSKPLEKLSGMAASKQRSNVARRRLMLAVFRIPFPLVSNIRWVFKSVNLGKDVSQKSTDYKKIGLLESYSQDVAGNVKC